MKGKHFPVLMVLMLGITLVLAACGGGGGGGSASHDTPGGASTVAAQATLPVGDANCPYGGVQLDYGVDDNANGVLDTSEVEGTEYICNGAPGATGPGGSDGMNALIETTMLPVGDANCPDGGYQVDSGLDLDASGTLDPVEVTSTSYLCNGAGGSDGTSGQTALISTTPLPVGNPYCPYGGYQVYSGIDDNEDGTLQAGEVDSTDYICNGAPGASGASGSDGNNGLSALIDATTLPVGDPNCPNGGAQLDFGIDDNSNGILDLSEVDGSTYICNGADGSGTQDPLVLNTVSVSQIDLDWSGMPADPSVAFFEIYMDRSWIDSTADASTSTYAVTGLEASTVYCFMVTGMDSLYNVIVQSPEVCAATSGGHLPSEGSVAAPVDITGLTPYAGTVDTASSYYMVSVTPGTAYSITLAGLSDDVDLRVYDDDSTFTWPSACSSQHAGTTDEECSLIASGNEMYIEVDGKYSDIGASYTVDIQETWAGTAEGTIAAPVDITGLTPHAGTVDTTSSYYMMSVTQGTAYSITLNGLSDDVDLRVYDDDSTFTWPSACSSEHPGTTDEECSLIASGTEMYLEVDGQFTDIGASYTLDVQEITAEPAEGSAGAPVDITGLTPYAGTVDTTSSYYMISVTPGTIYSIFLTGLSDNVDLNVYDDDSTFTAVACSSREVNTNDETCALFASGTVMYIAVDGTNTLAGASYGLVVRQNGDSGNGTVYTSTDVPKDIPDIGPAYSVDSTLPVSGGPYTISDINVAVDITHSYDGDLVITLTSPSGTSVILSDRRGGFGDGYEGTVFDDEALTSIASGSAPFTGSFMPDEALSAFDGEDPNGMWILNVSDAVSGDAGWIDGWSIEIK